MFNINTNFQTQGPDTNLSNISLSNNNSIQRHSQFHDQQLVEKFCQKANLVKDIHNAVDCFLTNYRRTRKPEEALAPLLLRLDFDFTELVKHGQQLLCLAIEEPLQFAEAVKYSVYGQVRDLLKASNNSDEPKVVDIAQLHIHWRILELPLQHNLLYDPSQFLYPLGLSLVHGILSAYTLPEILLLQSIWYCGNGCMRNAIQTTSTDAPNCPNCSRSMSEYQKLRVTENYRILALLPNACAQTPRNVNCVYRSILVRARAHTYDCDLKLGSSYVITGYYSGTATTYQFEACHLKKLIDFLRNSDDEGPADEPIQDKHNHGRQQQRPKLSNMHGNSSIVSNISPVLSSNNSGAQSRTSGPSQTRRISERNNCNPNTNQPVSFIPTDEDFPAVGTVRSKKQKAINHATPDTSVQRSVAAVVEGTNNQRPNCSGASSVRPSNNSNKVDKWLKSIPQPVAQSQQLPMAPPPLTQGASSSAPNAPPPTVSGRLSGSERAQRREPVVSQQNASGAQANSGNVRPNGAYANSGNVRPNGAHGNSGNVRPNGTHANSGNVRPNGAHGNSGNTRPNGAHGNSGNTRPNGAHGNSGNTRPNGAHGNSGNTRPNGAHGNSGNTRPNGAHGNSGNVRPNGAHANIGNIRPNGAHANVGNIRPNGAHTNNPNLRPNEAPISNRSLRRHERRNERRMQRERHLHGLPNQLPAQMRQASRLNNVSTNTVSQQQQSVASAMTEPFPRFVPQLPQSEVQSQTLQFQSQSEPQSGTQSEPQSGTQSEPQSGTQSEPQSGTQSEPQSGTQSEPQSGNQSEPQSGNQSEPQSGNQSEPQSGNQSEPQSGNQSEPQSGNQSEPQAEADYELLFQSQSEPQSQSQFEPQSQWESEPQSQSQSEPQFQSQSEPQFQSQSEPQFQSQSQSQFQSQCEPQSLSSDQITTAALSSTLNCNAMEFRPKSTLNPFARKFVSRAEQQSRYLISERRLRQRFHRTLKPSALFELVALPSDNLSHSRVPFSINRSWNDRNFGPTAAISPRTAEANNADSAQVNDNASQSVFRLASLPSTGIGTYNCSVPSTIQGSNDSQMLIDAQVENQFMDGHNLDHRQQDLQQLDLHNSEVLQQLSYHQQDKQQLDLHNSDRNQQLFHRQQVSQQLDLHNSDFRQQLSHRQQGQQQQDHLPKDQQLDLHSSDFHQQISHRQQDNQQLDLHSSDFHQQISHRQQDNQQLDFHRSDFHQQISHRQLDNQQLDFHSSDFHQQLDLHNSDRHQLYNLQPHNHQLHNPQLHNHQMDNHQLNNHEVYNCQLDNHEVVNYEVDNHEVVNFEVVNFEVGNSEVGNSEVGNSEVGNFEVGNSEVGNFEVGNSEVGNFEVDNRQQNDYQLDNYQPDNYQLDNYQLEHRQVDNRQLDHRQLDHRQLDHRELNHQLDFHQQDHRQLDSLPLLDMDPMPTQSDEMPLFLEDNSVVKEIVVDVDEDVELPTTSGTKSQRNTKLFGARHNVVDLNFMPSSIKKLYNLICSKYSDYAFIYALSAQLSQDCVPMECYVYLKMALLCSLVSIETDELRAPISLCIICTDSCVAHRLLHNVGQLAPRFIGPHEGGQQAAHTALPVRFNWVQASPLLLAQQGVYYAGDWNRLSRDQSEELEKCIENGSVPVPQIHTEQPLEAAIWTFWQPENANDQITALAKLCPIFGIPVVMDEDANDVMYNFILRKHSLDSPDLTQDALHIPYEDMQTVLGFLYQRQVTFTAEAQHLLQKYYVVSRIHQATAFNSKTYIVLKQFAESIAKLSMRLDVLVVDVIVAIFHCENFVRNIFGAGDNPPPAVTHFNVISKLDTYMNDFANWLYEYLDRYEDNNTNPSGIGRKRKHCEIVA